MKKQNRLLDNLILNESFQRYVLHKTDEDLAYWESYVDQNPSVSGEIERAKEVISFIASRKKLPKHQAISIEVLERLQKQIAKEQSQSSPSRTKRWLPVYGIAAAILVLFGVGMILKMSIHTNPSKEVAQYLEVIVPKGQRSQIVLPDGTKVWLNSGSILKYPTDFLSNNRRVYVMGEAFFNVKHDQGRPFVVNMRDNLAIKVLGTEFNVKCYPEEKTIEATLVKGSIHLAHFGNNKVVLNEIDLKPNEKAIYYTETKAVDISSLEQIPNKSDRISEKGTIGEPKKIESNEMELITSWKDEALVFKDESFEDIAIRMERWYGIKIQIRDESLKHEKFTGKFINKESIYQILDVFNRSEEIQYVTKDKEIVISKKKK